MELRHSYLLVVLEKTSYLSGIQILICLSFAFFHSVPGFLLAYTASYPMQMKYFYTHFTVPLHWINFKLNRILALIFQPIPRSCLRSGSCRSI